MKATGVHNRFELPLAENQKGLLRAVRQAHARGLRVLLVPHLWVESGGWRAEIDPPGDSGWQSFAEGYRGFVLSWARFAARARVDMLAVGVELRSWVTTTHAPSFLPILRDIRAAYPGPLTYAANWDDVDQTAGDLGSEEVHRARATEDRDQLWAEGPPQDRHHLTSCRSGSQAEKD